MRFGTSRIVLRIQCRGAPGEIASALRASSLRDHRRLRSGVQLGLRPSCRTRFVVCREFEFKAPRSSWLLAVLNAKNGGAPGEIASALRASSLRNHRRLRSGVQLGLRPSCRTRFVVCREFEFKAPRSNWLLAVLNAKNGGAPGEIASALRASSLRNHRRLRSGVQLGLRPSCRTRFVVCREFEFKAPRSSWLLAVLNAQNGGAPGEIASALRASSLRDHRRLRSGVQLGLRPSCRTRVVVCREVEFKAPRFDCSL